MAETSNVYWPEWRNLSADQQARVTALVTKIIEAVQATTPDEDV